MSPWFRDRDSLAFVAAGYLPWLAILNLIWETLQIPLYTLWTEGSAASIAFAIFHCTLGDILIGSASLAVTLIVWRAGPIATWRWGRVMIGVLVAGVGYTSLSEWLNTGLSRWTYSPLMPTLQIGDDEIGLGPLLQWIVLPALALWLGRRVSVLRLLRESGGP